MCLGGLALVVLCIVFMPDGWNIIPLILIALVLAGLSLRMKAIPCPPDAHPADQTLAAEEGEDRPLAATEDPPEGHTLRAPFGSCHLATGLGAGVSSDCRASR